MIEGFINLWGKREGGGKKGWGGMECGNGDGENEGEGKGCGIGEMGRGRGERKKDGGGEKEGCEGKDDKRGVLV